MANKKSLWLILGLFMSLVGSGMPVHAADSEHFQAFNVSGTSRACRFFASDKVLKTNLLSKVDIAHKHKGAQLFNMFDFGQLNVSSPYLPFLDNSEEAASQASLSFDLPEALGGFNVQGGVSFQVENQATRKTSSPQEHVIYVVSTKNISDSSWRPFFSLSYVRSQVRDISRAKKLNIVDESDCFSSKARFANAEVLGTCCGVQPIENLSMVLSYNYLKPLGHEKRLGNHHARIFDQVRARSYSNGVDFKLDYAVSEGLTFLMKSEYVVPNGAFRDTATDAPILIEGQLTVTF